MHCRVPKGTVDVVLTYCHYSLNDTTLEDLIPYLKSKGVGIVNAGVLSMGLLTKYVSLQSLVGLYSLIASATSEASILRHLPSGDLSTDL